MNSALRNAEHRSDLLERHARRPSKLANLANLVLGQTRLVVVGPSEGSAIRTGATIPGRPGAKQFGPRKKMSPGLAGNDAVDRAFRGPKACCDLLQRHRRGAPKSTYLDNLIVGESSAIMLGSAATLLGASTFLDAVFRVVFCGPKKKVIGIDATAIVASVTNHEAGRNGADVELIRDAMGANDAGAVAKLPVSGGVDELGPIPAPGLFRKTLFESFEKWKGFSASFRHAASVT